MKLFSILLAFILADVAYALYLGWRHPKRTPDQGSFFAKFTPGAIVSEIRNKIAATVFARNRGGAVIRNRATPINRRSTAQTTRRQLLSSLASAWRGLTAAQRASWNSAASQFPVQDNLGQTIFLTGEQLYVRSNANLTNIGASLIDTAPVPTTFPSITAAFAVLSDAAMTVAFTPDPAPAGYTWLVFATAPFSAGKAFVNESDYRLVTTIAAAATSPADIEAAYVAVFGALPATGQKVSVKIFLVEIASGLAGIAVRDTQVAA